MHVAPGAANSQNMEHAVQISTVILRWSGLAPSLSRQELPNEPPLCVRQIPTRQNRLLKSSLESRQTRFGNPVCQQDLIPEILQFLRRYHLEWLSDCAFYSSQSFDLPDCWSTDPRLPIGPHTF